MRNKIKIKKNAILPTDSPNNIAKLIMTQASNLPDFISYCTDPNANKSFDKKTTESIVKKNISIKDKLMAIDKIIEMYPNLKKDRDVIVSSVLGKIEKKPNTFVLEKILLDNISFYRDPEGNLVDSNINLIGVYAETDTEFIYYLFDDVVGKTKKILSCMKN